MADFFFYVYDYKLVKVLVFNEKFEYVRQFLDHGEGPGEVIASLPANKDLLPAPDGILYVCEPLSNKLIQFTAIGEHIRDIKMPLNMKSDIASPPVFDEKGILI